MSRDLFAVSQEHSIEFLHEMSFGFLGTVDAQGNPNIKPLNYVFEAGILYFHGSLSGEKAMEMAGHNRVTFAVSREFSMIPSYVRDPKLACPASVFFKSVLLKGVVTPVESLGQKASALTLLMQKLQPEGGYQEITPMDPQYLKNMRGTAVWQLVPDSIVGKFKFGQNLSPEVWQRVYDHLRERGEDLEIETASVMKRFSPHKP